MSAYLKNAQLMFVAMTKRSERATVQCPHCNESHHALRGEPGAEPVKSITCCPHCDGLMVKEIKAAQQLRSWKLAGAP